MKRAIVLSAALAVVFGFMLWMCQLRFGSFTGDSSGVYYPAVRALRAGEGLISYAPLTRGSGRLPGYPTLLAAASLFDRDLIRAGQIAGVLGFVLVFAAMCWLLVERTGSIAPAIAAVLFTVTHPTVTASFNESLPDAACAGFLAGGTALAVFAKRRALWFAGAGAMLAIATLIRINAGIAIPGLLIGLLWARSLKLRDAPALFAGCALVALPAIAPTLALRKHGVEYPVFSVIGDDAFVNRTYLEAFWVGLREVGDRLAHVVHPVLSIIAVVSLIAFAFWRRDRAARVVLASIGAVLLGLTAFHFEPRYYVVAIPLFAAASAAGVFAVGARVSRIGAEVLVVAAGGLLAARQIPAAIAEAEVANELRRGNDAVCRAIEEQSAGIDGEVMIGMPQWHYEYSYFRNCPKPDIAHSRFHAVPAVITDLGLDFWVDRSADDSRWEVAARPRLPLGPVATATTSTVVPGWSIEQPRALGGHCVGAIARVAPGRYQLNTTLSAKFPLTARLVINSGGKSWAVWGFGAEGRRVQAVIEAGAEVELILCAGDSLIAGGPIRAGPVELIRID